MKRIVIIIVYNDLNLLLQIFYIPCCTEYGELSSYILISFERIRFSTLLGESYAYTSLIFCKNDKSYVHIGFRPCGSNRRVVGCF